MKIQVRVKTGARCDCVGFDEEKNLHIVSTKALPVAGKANESIIKLLAKYFKVPKSNVTLKTGSKSKIKVFEIDREL